MIHLGLINLKWQPAVYLVLFRLFPVSVAADVQPPLYHALWHLGRLHELHRVHHKLRVLGLALFGMVDTQEDTQVAQALRIDSIYITLGRRPQSLNAVVALQESLPYLVY
jgi:hypothetical protein